MARKEGRKCEHGKFKYVPINHGKHIIICNCATSHRAN
jgi:hypothetical protein